MWERLQKLTTQTAVYGIGSVASKLVAIILLPLYAANLTPAQYGAAETILLFDLVIAALVKLGLQNSMMRYYYENEKEGRGAQVTTLVFWVTMAATAIACAVLLIFAGPIAGVILDDSELDHLVRIGALLLFTSNMYAPLITIFRLQHRPSRFAMTALSNVFATAAFMVTFIVFMDYNASGLLLGNAMGTLVLLPILFFIQRKYLFGGGSRKLLKELMAFGIPMIPMGLTMQGFRFVDRYMLVQLSGLAATGLYSIGNRTSQVIILVITALQMSWQPFAYSIEDDDEARDTYAYVMTMYLFVIGWMVSGLSVLAVPVIEILTPPEYADAALVVPLLASGGAFYGCYFIANIGTGRAKNTKFNFVAAIFALVASIGLNYWLIPIYGLIGAGLASLGANVVLAGAILIRAQRLFWVPYQWTRLAKVIAITAIFVAGSYQLPDVWWSYTLATLVAWCFPLIVIATGFLTESEKQALRNKGIKGLLPTRKKTKDTDE